MKNIILIISLILSICFAQTIGGAGSANKVKGPGDFEVVGELIYGEVEKRLFVDLTKMKLGVGNPPTENVTDGFASYDFDKDTDEETFSTFYGPYDWKGGTDADVCLGFFVATAPATAKNVVWGIEYKSIASDGIFDFTSGTTTVLDTVAITTGTPANDKKVHDACLVIPNSGLVEGGILMLRIYRDANNGNDDFEADAKMFDTQIVYRSGQLGKY